MSDSIQSTGKLSPERLTALFAAIDAKDSAAFAGFLTEDGRFRFGSAPEVRGRKDVATAVDAFFETIAGLSHDISMTMQNGSTVVCEGEVSYTRHDGSSISLPFADVFELVGDEIADYKIYMDIAPLYAN